MENLNDMVLVMTLIPLILEIRCIYIVCINLCLFSHAINFEFEEKVYAFSRLQEENCEGS